MRASWFPFGRRDDARLELYGKLALAKDYLRVGCAQGNALALREWSDAAFARAIEGAAPATRAEVPDEARPASGDPREDVAKLASAGALAAPILAWPACFASTWRERDPVIGCAWPSSDAGGLRPFPFFLAIERGARAWRDAFASGAIERDGAWEDLAGAYERLARASDVEALLREARATRIGAAREAPASEHPTLAAWSAAVSRSNDARAAFAIAEKVAQPLAATGVARLPLAHGAGALEQVRAWCELFARRSALEARIAPRLWWPQRGAGFDEPWFAVVWSRAPEPGDVRWLTSSRAGAAIGPGDAALPEPVRVETSEDAPDLVSALAAL